MSSAKYWRDERSDDAVYAVYLRKVRYVAPNSCQGVSQYRSIDPDRPDDNDHLQWETVKERVIKAGTLDRLLEALVSPDGAFDTRHFNVFFATYRAFSSTYKVLCRILARYSDASDAESNGQTSAKPTKNAILDSLRSVLVCWLDMYPDDFYEAPDFASLVQLIEFCRHHQLNDVKTKAKKLKDKFELTAAEGGMKNELRSMDQHTIATPYESLDFLTSPQRVRISDVSNADVVFVAEQLTYWDAELFKQLLPNQCQGCVWSRRHKTRKEADKVYTVRATIDQFNTVSRRVMTSIIFPECRPEARARIIAKWIEIARELRSLKNFSSLKAVLSSLQSEPVHRLKSVWALVPSRLVQDYRDLSATFQDDDDESGARRILEEEGTAKNSPMRRLNLQRRTKSDVNLCESQGTVPYLGTFLTDLTMIDEAHPDFTEDGLINFEKRRKEFEVLAKIKLFQSAARGYLIQMDRTFCSWFQSIPALLAL
uniref:Ral guanine nucleotide dissociation stimulator-like 1 n=1 Tax=Plectus sambesii TaxID=2011161 RepID=A0A914XHU1_9BILA